MIFSCFLITNVKAEANFFVNDNGVHFTKCEYEYISKLVWDGFQDVMTMNDFSSIFNYVSCENEIERNNSSISTFGLTHTTQNKSLNISKSCTSSNCVITTTLDWINSPNVRSYDVIGAYLDGTNLVNSNVITYVNNTASTEIKSSNNGFGVSIKLPSSGSEVKLVQIFTVQKSGTIYASYQHAVRNISLANSKKYTISRQGYGGVLLFDETYRSYYDGMGGVNISL